MAKKLNKEIMDAVKRMGRENSLWGYIADKKLYRADEVAHLLGLPFNFRKW